MNRGLHHFPWNGSVDTFVIAVISPFPPCDFSPCFCFPPSLFFCLSPPLPPPYVFFCSICSSENQSAISLPTYEITYVPASTCLDLHGPSSFPPLDCCSFRGRRVFSMHEKIPLSPGAQIVLRLQRSVADDGMMSVPSSHFWCLLRFFPSGQENGPLFFSPSQFPLLAKAVGLPETV